MDSAFLVSPEDALSHFGVAEQQGLSEQQVDRATKKFGRNGKIVVHLYILKATDSFRQLCQKTLQPHYGSWYLNNSRISL